jgi:23S rRNA (pseudouridine1915-N3)-methyltransferase
MRRATIVAVGSIYGWAAEGCDDYLQLLRHYFPVEVVEVPEEKMNRRSTEEVLTVEGDRILKRLPAGAHLVALDREKGRQLSSEKLAQRLTSLGISAQSRAAFVLGGPLGLSPKVLGWADEEFLGRLRHEREEAVAALQLTRAQLRSARKALSLGR